MGRLPLVTEVDLRGDFDSKTVGFLTWFDGLTARDFFVISSSYLYTSASTELNLSNW